MIKRVHYYTRQPDYAFWSRAVASVEPEQINPVINFPFTLKRDEKIATAGSCFAQHIARNLDGRGYCYYVAEDGHPLGNIAGDLRNRFNYGVYSARFGNVYTSLQLVQLFDRAYGKFKPEELNWTGHDGRWYDPFRPSVEPDGFQSESELLLDRDQHFSSVRRMFEELDVFVFTLGLTECWISRSDGAVFPICPGVIAGEFSESAYEFANLDVATVIDNLSTFLEQLRSVNPNARVIFTVSPVPLVATAEDRHVLVSTVVSKSVLRAAVDVVERKHAHVAYFPSFEIVTSSANAERYFAADRRSVTDVAVEHVMRLFFQAVGGENVSTSETSPDGEPDSFYERVEKVMEVVCEEESLERD